MSVATPLAWLADRVVLGGRALRWSTAASLVVSILIVLGGGVVRVTGSGLGCPTWPVCEAGSLTTTPALGIHGLIEFGNRMLTGVLCLAVAWVIVAARLQRVRQRPLTRLAWSQFWLVVVNAVAGGITVWTGLNPYVVAFHFVLAFALLTTTTLTWHRARQSQAAAPIEGPAAAVATVLVAVTALLVLAGTVVTGAGPHSGDSAAVARMDVNWTLVATVHGMLAIATVVITVALLALLRGPGGAYRLARRRTLALLGVLLAQAAVGIVQALTALPAALVVLHLVGAALVWIGALRVLLDVRPGLFGRVLPADAVAAGPRPLATAHAGRP